MFYIESDSTNPYWNLALEEYIFNLPDPEKEYFMLWQNKNTIVVGKTRTRPKNSTRNMSTRRRSGWPGDFPAAERSIMMTAT